MKFILDCDPGHDDMVMILYALQTVDVLGITTVAGNQSIEKVTRNALSILEWVGRSGIPVARGAGRSLRNSTSYAPELHGDSGLDGFSFPAPSTVSQGDAVGFMRRALKAQDDVTIVATGPLTNLACLLVTEPVVATRVKKISLMGGSTGRGNMTTNAEFNIFADPEAADVVFASGIPIEMYGLNVTAQVPLGDELVSAMGRLPTRLAPALAALMGFYVSSTERLSGRREANLHDLCAVLGLVRPDLFEFEPMYVRVELCGELTRGMTVCDDRFGELGKEAAETPWTLRPEALGRGPNTRVAVRADGEAINAVLLEALGRYT